MPFATAPHDWTPSTRVLEHAVVRGQPAGSSLLRVRGQLIQYSLHFADLMGSPAL